VKGFVLDDERLKEGRTLGTDYFDELLERIRNIRASEKRFYQKIWDIYKLAVEYDANAEATKEFFQIVQNKRHWAIAGKTAAEIIAERADARKSNMGLTTWKGTKVRRADVAIAKNYLNEKEVGELNRIAVMYLDYAEDQTKRRRPLYMRDWREKLDAFLRFNEREVLKHPGKVSMEVAQALAVEQFEKFDHARLAREAAADDDIDRVARQLEKPKARPRRGSKGRREKTWDRRWTQMDADRRRLGSESSFTSFIGVARRVSAVPSVCVYARGFDKRRGELNIRV